MNVKKITPVLFVKEIEAILPFWTERLGFTKTVAVPQGDKLGFVLLQKDNVEVMYQTYASAKTDLPMIADAVCTGLTFIYVEVSDVGSVFAAMKGVPLVFPMRTTFYGAKEFGVKDPAAHFVVFAQMGAATQP